MKDYLFSTSSINLLFIACSVRDGERRQREQKQNIGRALSTPRADVSARDARAFLTLDYASQGGTVDLIRGILEHGADVTSPGPTGKTALHIAAEGKYMAEQTHKVGRCGCAFWRRRDVKALDE